MKLTKKHGIKYHERLGNGYFFYIVKENPEIAVKVNRDGSWDNQRTEWVAYNVNSGKLITGQFSRIELERALEQRQLI